MFRTRVLTIVMVLSVAGVTGARAYGQKAAAKPTAAQQQRFEKGSEVYKNICAACHQPDGRGRERIAPSLVESSFAIGSAAVPIRILLQGKRGAVGLMPPLAGTLTDEQTADVLTYVRREWGHHASAVDQAAVERVRKETADRSNPWTDDELRELAPSK